MQEAKEAYQERIERGIPMSLFDELLDTLKPVEPAELNRPHLSGMNRKQRRALAKVK